MLSVRYELNTYMLFRRNSVFRHIIELIRTGEIGCSVSATVVIMEELESLRP